MKNLTITALGVAVILVGLLLGHISGMLQSAGTPAAQLAAMPVSLAALLAVACPSALAAASAVDRMQRYRALRARCV